VCETSILAAFHPHSTSLVSHFSSCLEDLFSIVGLLEILELKQNIDFVHREISIMAIAMN
jgi:hypothetical protein